MKTRNGFVSNSSSSSFIILSKKTPYDIKSADILSDEQIAIIKENELFRFTETSSIGLDYKYAPIYEGSPVNYYIDVICNQDEVVYFLLKNNIPFIASVHYEDETWRYFKDSENIYVTENLGKKLEFSKEEDIKKMVDKPITKVKLIDVKEWIKTEEKFWNDNNVSEGI